MSVLEAHETTERSHHAHEAKDPFINRVSITIALLAVSAAIVGSLETVESAAAIRASSQAVLSQDRATDAWNEYQADSLKKHLYGIAADTPGPNAARYRQVSTDQIATQKAVKAQALAAEHQREALMAKAEVSEHRHHWLTAAAAFLEIGIGVSSVAIITRKRAFWWNALGLGVAGAAIFVLAWVM